MTLDAFIEWVKDGGVSVARLHTWRPIAERLLRSAGSGRVLEGHILSLIDASQGSPGEVTLIEEVGEALLRYQALAKTPERTTREMPKLRAPTGPVPTAPRTPTPAPEKLVSFDAPVVATPAPALAIGSVPPAQQRSSNVHFRCPKCKMMVAATEAGVCPTCGTKPPSAVMTSELPPRPVMWKRVAVAVVALAAAYGLYRVGARLVDRLSHPSVAGLYPARAVGLQINFEEGWRVHSEAQADLDALGIDGLMAVARFSRDDGDMAVASGPRPEGFTDARLGQLADAGPEKLAGPLRALGQDMRFDSCIASGRRLRCLGADGRRRAAAYVTLLPKQVVVVTVRSTRNLEEVVAEMDALVDSLRPL